MNFCELSLESLAYFRWFWRC